MRIIRVPNNRIIKKIDEGLSDFNFDDLSGELSDEMNDYAKPVRIAAEETLIPEVEEWLRKYYVKNYNITPTGDGIIVDIDGDLNLQGFRLLSIPDIFRFGHVAGDCNFANNYFTSWKYFPETISGDCLAVLNKIQSFDGAPDVGGEMIASRQKCKTLYPLDDRHFRQYKSGKDLTESLVYIKSADSYGKLSGISADRKSCTIVLESGKQVYMPCDKVEVVNGIKYIEESLKP